MLVENEYWDTQERSQSRNLILWYHQIRVECHEMTKQNKTSSKIDKNEKQIGNAEEILPRNERKQNSVVESFNLAQRL